MGRSTNALDGSMDKIESQKEIDLMNIIHSIEASNAPDTPDAFNTPGETSAMSNRTNAIDNRTNAQAEWRRYDENSH